ncbi:MAG: hypothetical protein WBV73_13620, partial [Phormidium sp.]
MTRAKKRLFISAFLRDSQDYCKSRSRFINSLPSQYLVETPIRQAWEIRLSSSKQTEIHKTQNSKLI